MGTYYQHGDVILRFAVVPEGARRVPVNGLIVLARGEATGHRHVVDADDAELYERDGVLYLRVTAPAGAPVRHEEHPTRTLPPGDYRVDRRREADPFADAVRLVTD